MIIQEISSTQNATIKNVKTLHTAKGRKSNKQFLIEGPVMLNETLRTSLPIDMIFCVDHMLETYESILLQCAEKGAAIYAVSEAVLHTIADTVTPQGIIAVLPLPDAPAISEIGQKVLFLEDVQDPGNVGTLFRSALAFGFTSIIMSDKCADPCMPKIIRSSMGAFLKLQIFPKQNMIDTLSFLAQQKYQIIGTTMDGIPLSNAEIHYPLCLIIGNEAEGMSEGALSHCSMRITLPMRNNVQSLNAAIAGSICMYHIDQLSHFE